MFCRHQWRAIVTCSWRLLYPTRSYGTGSGATNSMANRSMWPATTWIAGIEQSASCVFTASPIATRSARGDGHATSNVALPHPSVLPKIPTNRSRKRRTAAATSFRGRCAATALANGDVRSISRQRADRGPPLEDALLRTWPHDRGGPGSAVAVYHRLDRRAGTAAACKAGGDDAAVEGACVTLLRTRP